MAEPTTIIMTQNTNNDLSEPEIAAASTAPSTNPVPSAPAAPDALTAPASQQPSVPRVSIHKLYALPAPIRTFPLPTFYPSNPLSLFHLVYVWMKHMIFPPAAEPSVVYEGVWDPSTRSVHITDPNSIRALWEQGFFGKGSLSRSEPNWLKREISRRGTVQGLTVSEQHTEARREERRLAKWERAKTELEVIERQRLVESVESNGEATTDIIPTAFEEAAKLNGEQDAILKSFEDAAESDVESSPELVPNGEKSDAEAEAVVEPAKDIIPDKVEPVVESTTEPRAVTVDTTIATSAAAVAESPAVEDTTESNAEHHVEKRPLEEAIWPVGEPKDKRPRLEESPVDLTFNAKVPKDFVFDSESPKDEVFNVEPLPAPIASNGHVYEAKAPVGPAELLALPNSSAELASLSSGMQVLEPEVLDEVVEPDSVSSQDAIAITPVEQSKPPVGPAELLALPNSLADLMLKIVSVTKAVEQIYDIEILPNLSRSPVGPAELLALPNSMADLLSRAPVAEVASKPSKAEVDPSSPEPSPVSPRLNGNAEKSSNDLAQQDGIANGINTHGTEASVFTHGGNGINGVDVNDIKLNGVDGAHSGSLSSVSSLPSTNGSAEARPALKSPQPIQRRKSVRFSPRVVSNTFQHFDPPSPSRSTKSPPSVVNPETNGIAIESPSVVPTVLFPTAAKPASPEISTTASLEGLPTVVPESSTASAEKIAVPPPKVLTLSPEPSPEGLVAAAPESSSLDIAELPDKEHFQLAPEEAFFLSFALGALSVVDPVTRAPIPNDQLLTLFRANSYFPPKATDSALAGLQPSDPFLVQYAVYHHFRSLGWVPRHGIKFGVDFILYQRGPVFDHSEFGVIIMPSFSDPLWKEYEHEAPRKSWSWLMGVNRVLAHVLKGLVLVYVDIPPPPVFDEMVRGGGIAAALKKFTIREVMVRRFSVNRNR
ncbi:tRNA intron endonuclease [Podospora appendiculata]|uniref:tRNA-intron lyase n=1 Tax=Podospora appendiculata TaxID=314037 RepID=A0AAE1CA70_9PEZI|nr:tRNA intron endonuclease [Podospora appendiculata]